MHTTVFERQRPDARLISESLEGSRLQPFWLDDLPERPVRPALAATVQADLAVVGGGYTGLWTALLAKRRNPDARVVLLEGKRIGWAASGRNGGFVEATLTHGAKNGETRFPDELATLDRLGMQNLDEIQATVEAEGWACDFERVGSFTVATEPYQVAELEAPTTASTSCSTTPPRCARRSTRPPMRAGCGRCGIRRSCIPQSSPILCSVPCSITDCP